ncbi:UDP-N-acetyl-2-amino-2-deoxyglucuronate dehydrogenase [Arthrobacter sp. V4I6]|uniref:Gfo/Idh/MocA family protein n=1 Tax=unclassified Arthrobacter TaxID=235627 RepID=UPI002786C1B2|nr:MULTISPECIES: Gfo/Idh/MocA family oxidoreductase [unclassified Arthrobacter]MDQ0820784.1 UDP-N-acetyl-2-amino-2-deoxyglucuronate dehydrogenase [Arthrobacter sp. V1I7]MDQ0855046.1 UDP-N-acetyl-2-amino-2-deoxyglucuronate dehydrogenase [Arthrobacter sp. V4I6]
MTVRAAVIGCGDVSSVHFGAIAKLEDVELVAVCDTDPGRLAAAVAGYGVPGFADHLSLLAKLNPDVVHISTPHHQHAAPAADCLERGVNVIVEKPLAHTLAEGHRLMEATAGSSAKIAVCFQNRYNATSQAMHALLSSGELGAVLGASATVMWQRSAEYYLNRPWRGSWAGGGGGLMMNQAIHTVDLLQWLVGDVVSLSGNASTRFLRGAIEVEDTAEFVAEHAGGARSAFYATLANAVNAPVTLDIVTEQATLSLRGDLTVTHQDGRVEVVPERLAESGGRAYWGVSHELLIADFYARLGEDGPFWIDPSEAAKSLRIVKEIYRQSYPELHDIVC